ncbi:MAG: hypothetical protein WCF36_01310 [Candidatus Nanopelagicales bacterium]
MGAAGHPIEAAGLAVAVHGLVGADDRAAKIIYLKHKLSMFKTVSTEVGRPGMARSIRSADLEAGMVFAGGPNEFPTAS